jgi:hypothetical protein
MCFSTEASFGAGAVLGVIGVISMTKARTNPQRMLATIPVLFSVQQFSEGLLWLSFEKSNLRSLQPVLVYVYLSFALAIWPLWIPLTTRLLEKDRTRKKQMNVLLVMGIVVMAGVIINLFMYPVVVTMGHHHLNYTFSFPPGFRNIILVFTILYILATIATPFISTTKGMPWLGVIFLTSYIAATSFFDQAVVSVWCFFAAILSVIVLWILIRLNKTPVQSGLLATSLGK